MTENKKPLPNLNFADFAAPFKDPVPPMLQEKEKKNPKPAFQEIQGVSEQDFAQPKENEPRVSRLGE